MQFKFRECKKHYKLYVVLHVVFPFLAEMTDLLYVPCHDDDHPPPLAIINNPHTGTLCAMTRPHCSSCYASVTLTQ